MELQGYTARLRPWFQWPRCLHQVWRTGSQGPRGIPTFDNRENHGSRGNRESRGGRGTRISCLARARFAHTRTPTPQIAFRKDVKTEPDSVQCTPQSELNAFQNAMKTAPVS